VANCAPADLVYTPNALPLHCHSFPKHKQSLTFLGLCFRAKLVGLYWFMNLYNETMKICICCSKKFFPEIKAFIDRCNNYKNYILTPELNYVGVINIQTRKTLADKHHHKIQQSDAIYIYNPDGFIGRGTNLEMGFALALNKKIFALEKINDLRVDCFINKFLSLEELISLVKK